MKCGDRKPRSAWTLSESTDFLLKETHFLFITDGVLEIMKRHETLYRDHESLRKIHPPSEALVSCSSHSSLYDLHLLTCIFNKISPRVARPNELE